MSKEKEIELYGGGVDYEDIKKSLNFTKSQDAFVADDIYLMTNEIVGKTMNRIEILGLPEKQERAVKDAIKGLIWQISNKTRESYGTGPIMGSPEPMVEANA